MMRIIGFWELTAFGTKLTSYIEGRVKIQSGLL